ncbi:RE1, partial [Symbiodinium necroappetens]
DFLEDGTRASQLQALNAEDSPFKCLSDSEKSAIAEGVGLDDKSGWNYLKAIPCSRQKRKRLMNMSWVIHLFAGEGKNADPVFKELEDSRVLVEVDITKSMAFDLFKVSGAYRALLWAAATGRVDGIIGAPCRREGDSVLLWKQIWLLTVAKAARAVSAEQPVFMMIEGAKLLKDIHSKDYDRWPSVKEAWGGLLEALCLEEFSPNIVTNLQLGDPVPDCGDCSRRWTEPFKLLVKQAVHLWDATPEGLQVTKWVKRLASGEPDYLQDFTEKELEMWKNHVQNNHRPFHRRCRTCVVSKGTGRIHRRVRHPDVHCLSLDIMGPFRAKSGDPNHRDYRYMLVGTYTMPKMSEDLEEETPLSPEPEDVPQAALEDEQVDDSGEREDQSQVATPVEEEWDELDPVELRKEVRGDSACDLKGLTEEEFLKIFNEVGKPYDVQVIYVSMPLGCLSRVGQWLETTQQPGNELRCMARGSGTTLIVDGEKALMLGPALMFEEEENVGPYDPEHAAEQYAAGLLEEDELVQDQIIEILVHLLPSVTEIPKRFGEQETDCKIWAAGAFVHGGVVGVKRATTTFPLSTKVIVKYVKQIAPDLKFNAIAVNVNVKTQEHKDVHNVGTSMIAAVSHFKGGGLDVVTPDGVQRLELGSGPGFFDPHHKHSTVPWSEGNRSVLLAYSIRDSGKLTQDKVDILIDLGFCWVPHLSATVPQIQNVIYHHQVPQIQDMDIAIQDLEEKAERLRSLLEEEEILVEQYSRVESESRGHLEDTRSQISEFLDYIHEELVGLEKVRMAACLSSVTKSSSSRTSEHGSEDVDYEKLLDELEDDLRVVHTVPVAQVKRVLERWVESIKKEVENLFASKTLRRVTAEEARRLEKSGQVMFAPAKCVFTLKPPQEAGRRAKRKCRLVICGNYVERGQEGQEDLYAAGTSSDSLRMSLVIAAIRGWLGAISDVTGAFLLATWPEGKTRYGFFPPKVVRDAGYGEGEAWIIERPIYGLRESPKIWSDFRNKRLRSARVKYGDITLVLRPTIVEPELWMILCEVTGTLYGLMVLYVDDILYLSNREVITAIHEFVTSEWPTSPLEWLEEHKAVRYLGVEILREPRVDEHGNQYHVYTIGQSAYVQDLLRSHDMQEVHPTQLPVPREWVEEAEASEEVEEGFTEDTLRRAQRVVGEGLWLSTRTRPDILYVINHLASLVAKRPDYVLRVGKRLLAYLAGTKDLRLQLGAPHEDDHAVICYTDASY